MRESDWKKYIIDPIRETLDTLGFDGVVLDFEGFRDTIENSRYSVDKRTGLKEKYT